MGAIAGGSAGRLLVVCLGAAGWLGAATGAETRALIDRYCVQCHNAKARTGGVSLAELDAANPSAQAAVWERVIAKLDSGSMPPPGLPRPSVQEARGAALWLEQQIDAAWQAKPYPGRANAVHRLNRTEFNNAIRDLLAVETDVRALLPGDETADGSFDNYAAALSISTAHLERYMSVARQVTRLAVGLPPARPTLEVFKIPLHVLQDDQESDDLPFGSRGGTAVRYQFPVDGEYLLKVRLQRQYQDYLKGMGWPQRLDVRLDGKLLKRFTVGGGAKGRAAAASYAGDGEPGYAGDPEWERYMQTGGDAGLEVRVKVQAGTHVVGVSFVREMWEPEGLPQPLQRGRVISNEQIYMGYANVDSVAIGGPYASTGRATDTASRRAIFTCTPGGAQEERPCAKAILGRLARLAYRRPVNDADLRVLLDFFEAGRRDGGSFDEGIQFALERMLADPDFLLRVHRAPKGGAAAGSYRLSDLEVASRLSFFLWGSVPDDALLRLAERGELTRPEVLARETRRMLRDPRALRALVKDFGSQWLNLRRLSETIVDPDKYPNYDETLLRAFERETEMFLASTIEEDRSVLDLLTADYTFANERLARHYGIKGISGSRFRRVTLPDTTQRGGLLAQGSVLTLTSYPDRTSPVLRGKWLLNNIFGLPVPPPPVGVDTNLESKPGAKTLSLKEKLAQHRQSATCNGCHTAIDPPGFALEHYDAIGGWRMVDEAGRTVDASGEVASGAKVEGLTGLRALLLERREQFPRTLTEKLMAHALGRRLDYYDRPAVRAIARRAAERDYRWSAVIAGIVESPQFLMSGQGGGTR